MGQNEYSDTSPKPKNMKTYKSEFEIVELVREGNSIVSSSDFSRLTKIGKKWGLQLAYDKLTNIQLWWGAVKAKYEALPADDAFKIRALNGLIPGLTAHQETNIMLAYIKQLDLEDEYNFLCSKKWDDLQFFSTYTLGSHGIDTTGGATIFIKNGGDYYGYISQYSKKQCDPAALKRSADLKKTIDTIFKGLEPFEKLRVANLILQCASTDMDPDEFHNTLFSGQ